MDMGKTMQRCRHWLSTLKIIYLFYSTALYSRYFCELSKYIKRQIETSVSLAFIHYLHMKAKYWTIYKKYIISSRFRLRLDRSDELQTWGKSYHGAQLLKWRLTSWGVSLRPGRVRAAARCTRPPRARGRSCAAPRGSWGRAPRPPPGSCSCRPSRATPGSPPTLPPPAAMPHSIYPLNPSQ